MRIALVGHAYHRLTKSSDFFLKILSSLGEVSCFYEDDGTNIDKRPLAFREFDYDLIVVWQIHQVLLRLSGKHPNVLFVPMYDAMRVGRKFYWHKKFSNTKVLSFCRTLHDEVVRRKAVGRYFQFFPDPSAWKAVQDYEALRAFFWFRKRPIDANLVFSLCGETRIDEFRLHNAPDPGTEPLSLATAPPSIRQMEVSSWFDDFGSYKNALQRSNVFFAPRLFEGIGMGFLEAMASGLCVVAPDNPTMNEYIENGKTGILYSVPAPEALNFAHARDIGLRAREFIERGFEDWKRGMPALIDFIATSQYQAGRRSVFSK